MNNFTYARAIAQGIVDQMGYDDRLIVLGVGVGDPKGIFSTTKPAHDVFPQRVLETPLSENMLTGACVGLAAEGWTPMLVHARVDFLMLTMEHLVNSAAKFQYIHKRPLHMVIRAITGRGWGQGPQHSQALHAMLMQVPGIRVFLPYTPKDAYEGVRAACTYDGPVVVLEHRDLYEDSQSESVVMEHSQQARVDFPSYSDWTWGEPEVTIVGVSRSLRDCIAAAHSLASATRPILCTVVDPRAWPLSRNGRESLLMAIGQTGRLVVADTGMGPCGFSAELIAMAAEEGLLTAPPVRVTPPFIPLPTSQALESEWYPGPADIVRAVEKVLGVRELIPAGTWQKPEYKDARRPF